MAITPIGSAIKKRSDVVAFYGIGAVFHRMRGFTEGAISKNPKEYTRQYIDEDSEQTDVVGYSPSMTYNFDSYAGNQVHEDIAKISDDELVGLAAVRPILVVDFTKSGTAEGSYMAKLREYAVIPNSEGNGTDAYTYSGTLRSKSAKEDVEVTSTDGFMTATIITGGGTDND